MDDIADNINTIKSIVNPGLIQFTYWMPAAVTVVAI